MYVEESMARVREGGKERERVREREGEKKRERSVSVDRQMA